MASSNFRRAAGSRLGTKSIAAVILLLSTISIALTSFFVTRHRRSLTDELRKRAFSLASNLAFNSQYPVLSGDARTLKNLLAGVLQESDIEQALIVDLQGMILAHADSTLIGRRIDFRDELDSLESPQWLPVSGRSTRRAATLIEFRRSPTGDDELLFFSPESPALPNGRSSGASGEKLGYVVLEVSLEGMNQALAADTRRAVLITLIMLIGGALATVYLVRSVAVPLQRLVEATRAVAGEDLDQTVPIDRTDEIGVLAGSFNHMISQLKASRDRIQAWNRELEAKVNERTRELEKKHRELEKAYESLKTLDKAKDDFLSLVSHELRTPLSSVLLYSEMLLDGMADSEETSAEFLTTIVENCKRLTRLINDVLDLSKIEAGRMQFKLEPLNMREIVLETMAGIRPKLEAKKVQFDCDRVADRPLLWGDRDKVIQVLTNIISNAIKFTSESGRITVELGQNGRYGRMAVHDTGTGIRREDLAKVFDRFSQLESIDHHSEGTGLGMTISKSIIERLRGRIWIESELGVGTTVLFTLPRADLRKTVFTVEEEYDGVRQEQGADS